MRIAERVNLDIADLETDLTYLSQLGVTDLGIMIRDWELWFGEEPKWHRSPGTGLREKPYYTIEDLLALKTWIGSYGLRLYSIMGMNLLPKNRVRSGQAEYDLMIENIQKSIVNMGLAGIEQFCMGSRGFAGVPVPSPFGLSHWRTSLELGRGGAAVVKFDGEKAAAVPPIVGAPVSRDEIWEDTLEVLRLVTPVAEKAGVTLCHHPADPPVRSLRGVGKILCSVEDFDHLFQAIPGDTNRMIFCLGCFSQILQADQVYEAIRHFGPKIAEVHFRNVTGDQHSYTEVYPDEGKLDMPTAIQVLKEVGFNGPIAIDHTPKGIEDTVYGHRGRAFEIGYLRGLLDSAS